MPCVKDVSARASALRAVGQAQSQFICAWGGLLSLLGGRLCISGCPLLSDVCAVSEGCHAQGLMATLRSASLRTWHRFATWIACGVLWCVEISAGESASLPSADKCGIMGLRFATRVLGFRCASRMSHPQTAGPPIIGVQTSVRRGRGLMLVYTRVCHSMCPGTLPRKFEIEGESTSHPFVDRCGSFATWVGVLPCVEDVSARATALRAVGQAQS